jgi:hypothetical protein
MTYKAEKKLFKEKSYDNPQKGCHNSHVKTSKSFFGSRLPHFPNIPPPWSKSLGGGLGSKSLERPLDSVLFPIFQKNFPPAAGQKSIKIIGDGREHYPSAHRKKYALLPPSLRT